MQAVAIGNGAGQFTQGTNSIAIGLSAGNSNQNQNAVAIGRNAGQVTQGNSAVAIGTSAGSSTQGANAIAIGSNAGATSQGANSIAIGELAGQNAQSANTIVINATGVAVNTAGTSRCLIAPIRGVAATTPVMTYDVATNEVRYNSSSQRYKKNISNFTQNTSSILQVQPRTFNTKMDDTDTHLYLGYVAEELDAIDTNFSYKIPDSNGNLIPESIEWFNMLIYAIEEIKKLNSKVISLQSQIADLQSQNP